MGCIMSKCKRAISLVLSFAITRMQIQTFIEVRNINGMTYMKTGYIRGRSHFLTPTNIVLYVNGTAYLQNELDTVHIKSYHYNVNRFKFIIRTEDPLENFVQKEYDILVTEPLVYDGGKPAVTIYANDGSDTANIG